MKKTSDTKYREVLRYFSNRPEDILVMNIFDAEDGWDKLCSFLGLPISSETPFPWLNCRKKMMWVGRFFIQVSDTVIYVKRGLKLE